MGGLEGSVDARKKNVNCRCSTADYSFSHRTPHSPALAGRGINLEVKEGMPNWNAAFAPVPSLREKIIASIVGQYQPRFSRNHLS